MENLAAVGTDHHLRVFAELFARSASHRPGGRGLLAGTGTEYVLRGGPPSRASRGQACAIPGTRRYTRSRTAF